MENALFSLKGKQQEKRTDVLPNNKNIRLANLFVFEVEHNRGTERGLADLLSRKANIKGWPNST